MVSQEKREEDERLREELRHVTPEKLKKVIEPLIQRMDRKKGDQSSIRIDRPQIATRKVSVSLEFKINQGAAMSQVGPTCE